MSESLDDLEERITALRGEIRRAMRARDGAQARSLRAELRRAEQAWDQALAIQEPPHGAPSGPLHEATRDGGDGPDPQPGSLLPVRERVHQSLTLLGVPAAAKMIVTVYGALRAGSLKGTQLTSLRRDEERSFRTAPFSRPYYLCAALTDRLSASRGLLAVSTWPLEQRVVGPLSPRVDFLTTAIRVAEHVRRLAEAGEQVPPSAWRLLSRLALNIPGAEREAGPFARGTLSLAWFAPDGLDRPGARPGADIAGELTVPDPEIVARAARAELEVHAGADAAARAEIAGRARDRLRDAERLFGGTALGLAAKQASC